MPSRALAARAAECSAALPAQGRAGIERGMWNQPYLETCCRAALHRLVLCGGLGRPGGLKDDTCLSRLAGMGFARQRDDRRFEVTDAGRARHAQEIIRQVQA